MSEPAIVIHDTTIVTADEGGSIHYGAALVVTGRRIAALGPTAEMHARYPDAVRVDGRGRAILPGFANAHTHLARTLARGIYEDLSPSHTPPFTGGLAPLPLPTITADEERIMVLLGALEAIRSGTTLVLEEGDGYRLIRRRPPRDRPAPRPLRARLGPRSRVDRSARAVRDRSRARRGGPGADRRAARALARHG
jgi:cytosine/adenosine deaminase-related metal-dependent hydrolase